MNDKILNVQKKIYDKAKYSNTKQRYILKEKHLRKLYFEVLDYVEEHLYVTEFDKINYIAEVMTFGLIEEVLDVLKVKND